MFKPAYGGFRYVSERFNAKSKTDWLLQNARYGHTKINEFVAGDGCWLASTGFVAKYKSITILIMQGVSLTSKAEEEIKKSKSIIDYFFTIEDIIGNEDIRKDLFKILKI